jgi:hypothetical protein
MKKFASINIGIAIVATVLSFFVAETVLQFAAPQNLSGTWRRLDDGISRNMAGGAAKHQLKERVVHYRFNSLDLRGGEIKAEGTRILFLGDSFTFGWLLDEDHTLTHHVQTHADASFGNEVFQVLNGGAGGWGTDSYLYFIEKYGDQINPEMILVIMHTEDVKRSVGNAKYILNDDKELLIARKEENWKNQLKRLLNRSSVYQFLLENSHLVQLVRTAFFIHVGMGSSKKTDQGQSAVAPDSDAFRDPSEEAVAYARALFRRLKSWCEQRNVELLVTTSGAFNERDRARFTSDEFNPTYLFMDSAAEFFATERIPFFDISPEYQEITRENPLSYKIRNNVHPNEKGSELMARLIWKNLKNHLPDLLNRNGQDKQTAGKSRS